MAIVAVCNDYQHFLVLYENEITFNALKKGARKKHEEKRKKTRRKNGNLLIVSFGNVRSELNSVS